MPSSDERPHGLSLAAFERFLEILSEASRHIPEDMKVRETEIPWPRVADIGNHLRHAYHKVDLEILWNLWENGELGGLAGRGWADDRAAGGERVGAETRPGPIRNRWEAVAGGRVWCPIPHAVIPVLVTGIHSGNVAGWGAWDTSTYSTNHVESFWKLFKHSVRSTHIHVSSKYMDRYLAEFTFRSNHRAMENAMFDLIVSRV